MKLLVLSIFSFLLTEILNSQSDILREFVSFDAFPITKYTSEISHRQVNTSAINSYDKVYFSNDTLNYSIQNEYSYFYDSTGTLIGFSKKEYDFRLKGYTSSTKTIETRTNEVIDSLLVFTNDSLSSIFEVHKGKHKKLMTCMIHSQFPAQSTIQYNHRGDIVKLVANSMDNEEREYLHFSINYRNNGNTRVKIRDYLLKEEWEYIYHNGQVRDRKHHLKDNTCLISTFQYDDKGKLLFIDTNKYLKRKKISRTLIVNYHKNDQLTATYYFNDNSLTHNEFYYDSSGNLVKIKFFNGDKCTDTIYEYNP